MFLYIPELVLENSSLSADCKLIVSYFNLLRKGGLKFFGKPDYVANILGMDKNVVSDVIVWLIEKGVLVNSNEGLFLTLNPEKARIDSDEKLSALECSPEFAEKLDKLLKQGWNIWQDTPKHVILDHPDRNNNLLLHKF